MRYIILIVSIILYNGNCFSQARLVLNNDGFVVLRNNVYLVVSNGNSNGIITTGTGGNIITEGEFNRVKWDIGTNTGTYVLPFTKSVGNKIPLSVTINTAGIGSGNVLFSTYGGANWDNSTYLPSDVTNIGSLIGGINNSAKVVDRFWIIDAQGYITKPSPRIGFTYLDAEWNLANNTILETALFAQRFSTTLNDWGFWFGTFGTANVISNTVNSGNVLASEFFRSWTLVNEGFILPIELLYFKTDCEENEFRKFEWATATENSNEYFIIEGSVDALNWQELSKLKGSGTSINTQLYENRINTPSEYNYFRLKQVDYNGLFKYSEIVYDDCELLENENIVVFPNPSNGEFSIQFTNLENELITVKITDAIGRLIEEKIIVVDKIYYNERYTFKEKVNGIYYITLTSNDKIFTQKLVVNY